MGGTAIRVQTAGANKGMVQRRATRAYEWTEAKQDLFFQHLSETANVTASARAAGMSFTNSYARRRRDPVFFARWKAALDLAYCRLEQELLRGALAEAEREERPETEFDLKIRTQSQRVALTLMAQHARMVASVRAEIELRQGGRSGEAIMAELKEKLAEIRARRIGVREVPEAGGE